MVLLLDHRGLLSLLVAALPFSSFLPLFPNNFPSVTQLTHSQKSDSSGMEHAFGVDHLCYYPTQCSVHWEKMHWYSPTLSLSHCKEFQS